MNAPHNRIKLGLIGDQIAQSQSPRLHVTAGRLAGLDVSYDRLVPKDLRLHFDAVFAQARGDGFRGVNITYPYKEYVVDHVTIADPLVRAIGAVNTVVIAPDGPQGFNTDYTGFIAAYREARGDKAPGTVCLIGTGGVGKAVAFGLIRLKAATIRCVDVDPDKANRLASALRTLGTSTKVEIVTDAATATKGADGIINCTPLGMAGIGGSPLEAAQMQGASWAFDAVYTPVQTTFLQDAATAGLQVISGYALFFHQGLEAFRIFTNSHVDPTALRHAIAD